MRTLTGLLATLAVFASMPSQAQAQRRGGGTVNTPFGQFSASEMAAAGGNPYIAQDIRSQKMQMQYEQQMVKQQQQYMQQMAKQQKARQDYLKAHPEVAKAEFEAQTAAMAAAKAKAMARHKPKSVKPKSTTTTASTTAKPASTKAAGTLKASREAAEPKAADAKAADPKAATDPD